MLWGPILISRHLCRNPQPFGSLVAAWPDDCPSEIGNKAQPLAPATVARYESVTIGG